MAKGYLSYKTHVCRQEYADVKAWKSRQQQTEEDWPEYKKSTKLMSSFKSLLAIDDPKDWCYKYLNDYVQPVQEMKQHHVHTLNGKGERVPRTHCRRADNPSKCKGDFPRTKWIISEAVVLCPGLAHQMDMAASGRRNRVGSLQGPQNDEYLNGTHPAMSVALPFNSDVQLPYRLPICAGTHASEFCSEKCVDIVNHTALIEATQYSQDAQIGYACDYQNKRAARCCNETKEFVKGHKDLASALINKPIGVISKRHVIRLCSDAYGKGIVRSLQESTNLRVYQKESDVLFAESIRTSGTISFPGIDATAWREALFANADTVRVLTQIHVDRSNPRRGTPAIKNLVFCMGIDQKRLLAGCYRCMNLFGIGTLCQFATLLVCKPMNKTTNVCMLYLRNRVNDVSLRPTQHMKNLISKQEQIISSKTFHPQTPTGFHLMNRNSLLHTDILGSLCERSVPKTQCLYGVRCPAEEKVKRNGMLQLL